MWHIILSLSFMINRINIPFEKGANKIGSKNSPNLLKNEFDFLYINKDIDINPNNFVTNILYEGYRQTLLSLWDEKFPLTIGGDHTVAIGSIFAANEYCNWKHKRLGILWFDAHADFNTMETSPTKNLHGMPIAVLCGHTLHSLKMSDNLYPYQFAYIGLRDIDSLEFDRIQDYDMTILESQKEIDKWVDKYDAIHVSFDIDCLDPSVTNCVNTPVKNGKKAEEIKDIFKKIKDSNKLISADLVEYNANKDSNHTVIVDIMKSLLK